MRIPEGIVQSSQGLFLFTEDGVFRYDDEGGNCFKQVKFCDLDDNPVTQSIGTVDDDPRNDQ